MKKMYAAVPVAALAVLIVACSDGPTVPQVADDGGAVRSIVLTEGATAPQPTRSRPGLRPLSDFESAAANVGGSAASAVSLKPSTCSEGTSQVVTITYTVTGRQVNPASFTVRTNWAYNGSSWVGTGESAVNVPAREPGDAPTVLTRNITVQNGSTAGSGTSSFTIPTENRTTSSPAALNFDGSDVTIHVAFAACPVTNTAPTLVLPAAMVMVEATSSAGASVDPHDYVTANDLEDGDLTADVECTPGAGTYALGDHVFDCSVTDSGGLSDAGEFTVRVRDTTPPEFTSIPTGTVNRIADNASGWTFDQSSFNITAADVGGVSEPVAIECTPAGTFTLGATVEVSCVATDARNNASAPTTFDVFVTLDVSGMQLLAPLRMTAPFSTHKRNSVIPHKMAAPKYADGTPVTNLAGGLRLELEWVSGAGGGDVAFEDPAAGSTEWRWDASAQQYVFNAKSASNWALGVWQTTVAYMDIVLASTQFNMNR
jgi:hypothetical protein